MGGKNRVSTLIKEAFNNVYSKDTNAEPKLTISEELIRRIITVIRKG